MCATQKHSIIKASRIFTPLLCGVLLLCVVFLSLEEVSATSRESNNPVQLLSADNGAMEFVFELDPSEVLDVGKNGLHHLHTNLEQSASTSHVNAQEAHTYSLLLGVPTHADLKVTIIESVHSQVGMPRAVELGKSLAASQFDNTNHPVRIDEIGWIRDQPVVRLQIRPVHVQEQAVQVFTKLRFRLDWDVSEAVLYRPNHPHFEQILEKTLFNYQQLNRPQPIVSSTQSQELPPSTLSSYIKIKITESGVYQITGEQLSGLGWDLSQIDHTKLQMWRRGAEIPIRIITDTTKQLSDQARVLFYAEGYEDLYVKGNVYWLVNGESTGLRISRSAQLPIGVEPTEFFTKTIHRERDSWYVSNFTQATAEEDLWFDGDRLRIGDTRQLTFTLSHVAPHNGQVHLHLHTKGHTNAPHQSNVSLNGQELGTINWAGFEPTTKTLQFTNTLLSSGVNTVTVAAIGDNLSMWYVNWLEIDYLADYATSQDELWFSTRSESTVTVTKLTSENVLLHDITDPYFPTEIEHDLLQDTGDGFQIAFNAEPNRKYHATGRVKLVEQLSTRQVADLLHPSNGADWIAISHTDFITAAQRLAAHRAQSGLRTTVVDVQDVYDTFGDGFFDPDAIQRFLSYTYQSWTQPAPTYVVLVGDGSQEYKTPHGMAHNWIPPKLIHTFDFGRVPSDNAYVTFIGDDPLAEMKIGRLSVETLAMAHNVVDNIISAESQPPPPQPTALLIADDQTQFESVTNYLYDLLPANFNGTRIFVDEYDQPDAADDIVQAFSNDALLVNYSGHGNHFRWGSYLGGNHILTEDGVDRLAGNNAFPFVTIANCLNGLFSFPYSYIFYPADRSMAEALHRQPNGGASAVWADAGLGYAAGQQLLLGGLYEAFFEQHVTEIGTAIELSKYQLYTQAPQWQQTIDTMILFGDPATELPITVTPPTTVTLSSQAAASAPVWVFYILFVLISGMAFVHFRRFGST